MPRKTLADFNYDYQAYANYLESAECANDDGYDIYVDVPGGNIYERTDGDWTKGHGHKNVNNGYDRDKDAENSKGRPWKNNWLKYVEKISLSKEEMEFLFQIYSSQNTLDESNEITLSKKI